MQLLLYCLTAQPSSVERERCVCVCVLWLSEDYQWLSMWITHVCVHTVCVCVDHCLTEVCVFQFNESVCMGVFQKWCTSTCSSMKWSISSLPSVGWTTCWWESCRYAALYASGTPTRYTHTTNTHVHTHTYCGYTHACACAGTHTKCSHAFTQIVTFHSLTAHRVCIILPLCSFIRPYPAEVINLCQSSPLWSVPLALYLSISVCQQLRAMSPSLNTTELLLNKSLVNKPSFITPLLLPIPPSLPSDCRT